MALQVWLPLNEDLHNQGLANISIINNSAIINNAGKIGSCYYFNRSIPNYLKIDNPITTATNGVSMAFWVKIPSNASGNNQIIHIGNGSGWNNNRCTCFIYQGSSSLIFSCSDGGGTSTANSTQYSCKSSALTLNEWTHVVCTYSTGIMKIYLNGVLDKEYTTTIVPSFANTSYIGVGAAPNANEPATIYINDVRIYDHCLSIKEVKELSKGLVLHYKLDNGGTGPTNLLKNGFGELGTENWDNPANVTTTDLPTADPTIKAKVLNSTSKEFIPVCRNHTYKISVYVKSSTGATTGYTYPSIRVYDIDKYEIENYHTLVGFNLATMTTLKQDLKSGDTKIYVNDLSQWNANSGHYYNHAAIFGYADSTGYIYPDGVYTRTTPAFGVNTNAKTNLDKTNNIITLNAAYSGPTIPAGTSVCASTDGSTFFYPFGGITHASIQDWVFKEATFSAENNRIIAAAYMKVMAFSNSYLAGITLIDKSVNDMLDNTKEFDCSGYGHNGDIIGTLTDSIDTPKYSASTSFDGTNDGILIEDLQLSNIINSEITYSFWIKPNGENGARSVYFGSYTGTSWSLEKNTNNLLRLYWNGSPDEVCTGATITDEVWQHVCIIKKGTNDVKVYINGQQKWTSTATHNTLTFPTTYRIGRDVRSGDGTPYKGLMSDFRIYATALSAEDVAELYHTAASVDNHGNIYAGELKEV